MSKDPSPITQVLGEMIDSGNWRQRLAAGRLRQSWATIVGDQIAAHSAPIRLSDGTLLIKAESGVWATELTLLSRQIVRLCDEWLGGGLIQAVKVVAGA